MKYTQCSLIRPGPHGTQRQQMAWIPMKYAAEGSVIKIKCGEEWEDGWIVDEVFRTVDEERLTYPPHEIRQHRKNTGDSLPKEK